MNCNDFIQIRYYVFPDGRNSLEDLHDIEFFKAEIEEDYNVFVKAKGTGMGGDSHEFMIHMSSYLHLSEFLLPIVLHLGGKVLSKSEDLLLKKYLFRPLEKAYAKLKAKNPILDCYSFRIELKDADIFIYRTAKDSLMTNLEKILLLINSHVEQIKEIENSQVNEIHIPVVADSLEGQDLFRVPLGMLETIDLDESDLFKYWGIISHHGGVRRVHCLDAKDVSTNTGFHGCDFYLEDEFLKKKFPNA